MSSAFSAIFFSPSFSLVFCRRRLHLAHIHCARLMGVGDGNSHQVKSLWPTEWSRKRRRTESINRHIVAIAAAVWKNAKHMLCRLAGWTAQQFRFWQFRAVPIFRSLFDCSDRSIHRKTNLIMHLPFQIIYNLENYLLKSVYLCLPFVFTSCSVCSLSLCLCLSPGPFCLISHSERPPACRPQ